ncbi:MAG: hypothetical protein LBT46_08840 [Planctomycetaceae bacterium]|nr:hypothetical protein [Planctomycetaceae bacterium]
MTSVSKLDYLMKSLNVLGAETAAVLQIDSTTISKWRNNQRSISRKNGQARQLAEFLLQKEKEQNVKIIFDILKTLKEDINPESIEQQIEALSFWLTEKKLEPPNSPEMLLPVFTPQNGYNTNISVFLDDDGIDEAMTSYLEYVLRLPPGQILYLVDYSGIKWTKGDELTDQQERINRCMNHFRAVSHYGHRLIIIDCNTDVYRPYRAIFRWMELYLLDGVEVWSCSLIHDDAYHYTNFIIENEIVLQCISNTDIGGKPHSLLYTNKETVDFFFNNVTGIMKKSKRLIESVPVSEVLTFMDIVQKSLKPKRPIYMLNPSLTLQLINSDLLKEILETNGILQIKIDECLAAAKMIQQMQHKNYCSYLCNLDYLEKLVLSKKIEDDNLSEICGQKVIITKKHLRKMIESLMRLPLYQDNHILFTSFDYWNAVPENLCLLVQEDCFIAAWNVKKYKKRLYCLNLDIISGFYRYIDDLKTAIPKICWDKNWQDKQLLRLAESVM